jgi:hypothetical protein
VSVLGKNVQNQRRAIKDFDILVPNGPFYLPLLCGRQLLVKNHYLSLRVSPQ